MGKPSHHSKSTVSLVVAVSGHRDLYEEDSALLQARVHDILEGLRDKYLETDLLLITGLAEGADRVAARAAHQLGIRYIAVLPMKIDLYRLDFKLPEESPTFHDLVKHAIDVITLPNCEGVTDDDLSTPGSPKRGLQYHALGRFLAQYSQILIAIWDGGPEIKEGGTNHVIRLNLGEITKFEHEEDFATRRVGTGPVYIVYARRKDAPAPRLPSLESTVLFPQGTSAASFDEAYCLLNRFNRDVEEGGKRLKESAEKSRETLVAEHKVIDLSPSMEWCVRVYSFADALANRFNFWSILRWQVVYCLLAITGVLLVLQHFYEMGWRTLVAYYGCIVVLAALINYEQYKKRRERHEDYRALAEALRVQFFWLVAGLTDLAADHYQTQQAGEMAWIRDTISECALHPQPTDLKPSQMWKPAQSYQLARTWITGQKDYFQKKSVLFDTYHKRYNLTALLVALLGVTGPLAAFIAKQACAPEGIERGLHAAAAILVWFAALGWSYVERRGWGYLARQYARMYRVFSNFEADLETFEQAGNFEFCRLTIFELGCEALAENAEWLVTHRERKLSLKMIAG
jgi:hypothetical protein